MARILIVEDEPNILLSLQEDLARRPSGCASFARASGPS
jgi:hypothetical protein